MKTIKQMIMMTIQLISAGDALVNSKMAVLILFCEVYVPDVKEYAQVQYFTLSNKYLFSVSSEPKTVLVYLYS